MKIMTPNELLDAIVANFDGLQGVSAGEFFFEIGMDGSSLSAELEIARTLRDQNFKRLLRKAGIECSLDRDGKLHFVEVTHG